MQSAGEESAHSEGGASSSGSTQTQETPKDSAPADAGAASNSGAGEQEQPAPQETAGADVTTEPEQTTGADVTTEPEETAGAEVTAAPEETADAEETVSPEPTPEAPKLSLEFDEHVRITSGYEHDAEKQAYWIPVNGGNISISWEIEDGFTLGEVKLDGGALEPVPEKDEPEESEEEDDTVYYDWNERNRTGSVSLEKVEGSHTFEICSKEVEEVQETEPETDAAMDAAMNGAMDAAINALPILPVADEQTPGEADEVGETSILVTVSDGVTLSGEYEQNEDLQYVVPVTEGGTTTIAWSVEEGYTLTAVTVDGVETTDTDSYWDAENGTWSVSFDDDGMAHTLVVTAAADEQPVEPVLLHPEVSVALEAQDVYDEAGETLQSVRFTATPTATLPEGETLPDGAEDAEQSVLVMALPAGVDRRIALNGAKVRCAVTAQVVRADEEPNEAESASAESDPETVTVPDSMLDCALSVDTTGSVTHPTLVGETAQDVVFVAQPVLSNTPADSTVSYSYSWQVYVPSSWGFGGTWRAYDNRTSPIRNIAQLSADQKTLTLPMPELLDDRESLNGLQVRCKVTASGYPVSSNGQTKEFDAVVIDPSLLKYVLSVTSDNTGATVAEGASEIRMQVTPKLSGAADTYKDFTYEWQYLAADGTTWTAISRDDDNCPVQYAVVSATSNAASSTFTLQLPESVESRKKINGTQVRCHVTTRKNNVTYEMDGAEATISIPQEMLTDFRMTVAEDTARKNVNVSYLGQPVYLGFIPTVEGNNVEDAVVDFKWSYKKAGSENFAPLTAGSFTGGEFVMDEQGRPSAYQLTATSVDVLKAINNAVLRCEVNLYAHGDALASGEDPELRWAKDTTISVKPELIADYNQAEWMTNARLEINPDVRSDAITNVGMSAFMELNAIPRFDLVKPAGATDPDNSYAIAVKENFYNGYAYHHLWEYRENEHAPWRPIETLPTSIYSKITVTVGTAGPDGTVPAETHGKSSIKVELPDDYASRIQLSGMQFRCTSSALAMAKHSNDPEVEWGVISATTSNVMTVIINPKLLRSQASSTRRIVAFLNRDAAQQYPTLTAEQRASYANDPSKYYDPDTSYQVFSFEDGVREERATQNFPESIVAVYEYQEEQNIETVVTKRALVEIPVPWNFVMENGRAYSLSASKAKYQYDAALAQVIPEWNAKALQDYIDAHPDPTALDYDEDDAVRWVVAASLNGRYPHIKVCWNTELMKLPNRPDYDTYNAKYGSSGNAAETAKVAAMAGSANNPYWKQTYSDWYFKSDAEFFGDVPTSEQKAQKSNVPVSEAAQKQWLEENYPKVRVLM